MPLAKKEDGKNQRREGDMGTHRDILDGGDEATRMRQGWKGRRSVRSLLNGTVLT